MSSTTTQQNSTANGFAVTDLIVINRRKMMQYEVSQSSDPNTGSKAVQRNFLSLNNQEHVLSSVLNVLKLREKFLGEVMNYGRLQLNVQQIYTLYLYTYMIQITL